MTIPCLHSLPVSELIKILELESEVVIDWFKHGTIIKFHGLR